MGNLGKDVGKERELGKGGREDRDLGEGDGTLGRRKGDLGKGGREQGGTWERR